MDGCAAFVPVAIVFKNSFLAHVLWGSRDRIREGPICFWDFGGLCHFLDSIYAPLPTFSMYFDCAAQKICK
jgi:hypothetical protein